MSETEFIVQEEVRFAVFPSLQFTCETGYVVRLWFLGRRHDSGLLQRSQLPQIPSFRLFSNLSQSFSNSSALDTTLDPQMVLNGRSERAVLTSVVTTRRESFNFTRGDFIGIMNPNLISDRLSILYHNSSGPTVYFQQETTTILSRSSAKSNNYPLLAIETGMSQK